MRRRPHPIRDSHSGRGAATASPGLRGCLLSTFMVAGLLALGCAPNAHAQSGIITTAVGPGLNGNASGDSLSLPTGVAVSGSGAGATIYTADATSCVVWQTVDGQTTIYAGELYQCAGGSPGSSPTATSLAYPVALAFCNGNLFIASHGIDPLIPQFSSQAATAGTVDEVDSSGTLSVLPLPGGPFGPLYPLALACDASGNVYSSSVTGIADGGVAGEVNEFSPAAGGGWTATTLVSPSDLFDQADTALAVNPSNGDLCGIQAGQVGDDWLGAPLMTGIDSIQDITKGTSALSANNTFFDASGLAIDSSGDFLISTAMLPDQYSSYVEQVTPNGTVTVLVGTGTPGYSGDGGPATSAEIDGVSQIVQDAQGNDYLADSENQRVRRIHPIGAGPSSLTVSGCNSSSPCPQSSGAQFGSLQGVLNPTTGDFYYVTGANTVNVINSGNSVSCLGCERIFASIPVGANNGGATSTLTMVVDPTQNFVYVSNTADGNLYVINGNPGTDGAYNVVSSVSLKNSGASLLAIDPGIGEVYATGPNSSTVSAVQAEKGISPPTLIGNYVLDSPAASISVDPASHAVYAVGVFSEYGSVLQELYTMTPTAGGGALTVNASPLSSVCGTLGTGTFLTNSIAADSQTSSLIVSGAGYHDSAAGEYCAFAVFSSPYTFYAPVPYSWQPFTTSLDAADRAFYLTDFDGNLSDNNSNATMVTGIDSVAPSAGPDAFVSTSIPVFGGTVSSPQAAASPHVYDVEPDSTSYQAWISGSDAANGGFVELWDASSQAIPESVAVPSLGGGNLFVDSTHEAAYLLDHVNSEIWLINNQWTAVNAPAFAVQGDTLVISAPGTNPDDFIFYTTDGSVPTTTSPNCSLLSSSPCSVPLSAGVYTNVSAFVYDIGSAAGSNVAEGEFAAVEPTTLTLGASPNPATTGASVLATATLGVTPGVTAVTGTVSFTANGVAIPGCTNVAIGSVSSTWQATCSFTEDLTGDYSIAAAFSGDTFNQPQTSNNVSLQVNQGTTPILLANTGDTNALAINTNNAAGLTYNFVLNSDTSVSLVQNGVLTGQGCPAFPASGSSLAITAGALYFDAVHDILYLGMLNYSELYAAYESINPATGSCTQGPLLSVTGGPNSDLQLNVDVAQGNVYLMNYNGANFDKLYVFPTAPWSAATTPTASPNLDYSAQYGVMQIDASNHQVYINDLGSTGYGAPGTYATSGFFVYDPGYTGSATNPAHVAGYIAGGSTTLLNIGTLLDNGSGKLVLVNANPAASSCPATPGDCLGTPITILDTTQFSFFTNTQPGSKSGTANITPGSGLSNLSAASQYSAISAADINVTDASNPVVYVETFNAGNLSQPGTLLQYSLTAPTGQQESVLSSSLPAPVLYDYTGPWARLNYNPESQNLVLSTVPSTINGALGMTTPLCGGSLEMAQLFPNPTVPLNGTTPLSYPLVNTTSGYVYDVVPASTYPPQAAAIYYVVPVPGCSSSTQLEISPSSLPAAIVGESYSQMYSATGGSGTGYTWSITSGGSALNQAGLTFSSAGLLSGTPTAPGTLSFTVEVTDSADNSASQAYELTIENPVSTPITISDPETITVNDSNTQVQLIDVSDPETITVTDIAQVSVAQQLTITTTSPLPQATLGQPYSETLVANGGSGTGYTWQVVNGGAGLSYVGLALSSAGVISGTPNTTEAAITFSVLVTDSVGNSAITTLVLTVGSPVPVIASTTPVYAAAGGPAFTLTVNGSGFVPSTTVLWGGTTLTTTYVSATRLNAQVPASAIAAAGTATISVQTPSPGGGTSTLWQFEVSAGGNGTGNPPTLTGNGSVAPGSSATFMVTLPAGATHITVECLNLPSGTNCSFANPTLTVTTSASTPPGTYTIVAVFTYDAPGAAIASLIFLPFLLLPIVRVRRRWAKARVLLVACVGLAILAFANAGCGGGGTTTHPSTSTAAVTLVVQ